MNEIGTEKRNAKANKVFLYSIYVYVALMVIFVAWAIAASPGASDDKRNQAEQNGYVWGKAEDKKVEDCLVGVKIERPAPWDELWLKGCYRAVTEG